MTVQAVDPHLFVVMGGRGDLMARKLLPALFHLAKEGYLADGCVVLGVARSGDYDDESFRTWAREALDEIGASANAP